MVQTNPNRAHSIINAEVNRMASDEEKKWKHRGHRVWIVGG
jgi:hypothetical protein